MEAILRCAGCGYKLTEEEFDKCCYDESFCKDNYIDLLGDHECPVCGDALEEIEVIAMPRDTLEELRDWLAQPQTTGGNFPMETHMAESEGLEHIYSEIVDALEGGNNG